MLLSSPIQFVFLGFGCLLLTVFALYFLLQTGFAKYFVDEPDQRKVHRNPIPRIGGVVFVIVFFSAVCFSFASGFFDDVSATKAIGLIPAILFASGVILLLGFFDDTTFFVVRVRHKLLAEFLIALATVFIFKIHIGKLSLFGLPAFPEWFGTVLSVVWIIGLANAYNIIDGLDGLATSVGILSFIAIEFVAIITGFHPLSILPVVVILSGVLSGFLLFNFPPAKTFMGDTGSIFLGTMVAILTLFVGKGLETSKVTIVLPLIAGLPIVEVFVTMVRRFFKARDKKGSLANCLHSIVIPDNSHIHHRLLYKGYSARQALSLIVILAVTLSCGAVFSILLPPGLLPLLLLYLAIPVYFTLYQLGFGGRFKKALHLSPTRYNGFRKQSLIGVIDAEGSFSERLEKTNVKGVSYIKMTEEDVPSLHRHLRAAVVRNGVVVNPWETLKKAEAISWLLKGPVFLVDDTNSTELFIREVSKNGTLSVQEKNASIEQLLKELKRLGSVERIRHLHTEPESQEQEPLAVC